MKLRIGTSGEMAHNVGYIPLILSVAESLEKFPGNARVFEVKKEYTGRVMSIERYYRYLTAFQLSRIATYGGKMLEKHDLTIKKLEEIKDDVGDGRNREDEESHDKCW
jgi:hypothetical protein